MILVYRTVVYHYAYVKSKRVHMTGYIFRFYGWLVSYLLVFFLSLSTYLVFFSDSISSILLLILFILLFRLCWHSLYLDARRPNTFSVFPVRTFFYILLNVVYVSICRWTHLTENWRNSLVAMNYLNKCFWTIRNIMRY